VVLPAARVRLVASDVPVPTTSAPNPRRVPVVLVMRPAAALAARSRVPPAKEMVPTSRVAPTGTASVAPPASSSVPGPSMAAPASRVGAWPPEARSVPPASRRTWLARPPGVPPVSASVPERTVIDGLAVERSVNGTVIETTPVPVSRSMVPPARFARPPPGCTAVESVPPVMASAPVFSQVPPSVTLPALQVEAPAVPRVVVDATEIDPVIASGPPTSRRPPPRRSSAANRELPSPSDRAWPPRSTVVPTAAIVRLPATASSASVRSRPDGTTTSSSAVGTTPVSQLDGACQLPDAARVTVAAEAAPAVVARLARARAIARSSISPAIGMAPRVRER
jgi:hypothetical protein